MIKTELEILEEILLKYDRNIVDIKWKYGLNGSNFCVFLFISPKAYFYLFHSGYFAVGIFLFISGTIFLFISLCIFRLRHISIYITLYISPKAYFYLFQGLYFYLFHEVYFQIISSQKPLQTPNRFLNHE